MFVQVIEGRVSDPEKLRERLTLWESELAPGASGWLGSTAGVTDDGRAVAVVRFESEEAARANSDRPEQGEWWAGTADLYDGEPTFRESTNAGFEGPGDPGQAGFVQVMEGQVTDGERARELMSVNDQDLTAFRPDILGRLFASYDDGGWTMVIYFTSEEEARAGEAKEAPPEMQQRLDEMQSLAVGPPTFHDLREPWFSSPG